MTKQNLPKRKSIRLKNYDYASLGWYYVTICTDSTDNRKCLFGKIINGKMVLNNAGKMINKWWLKTPERFKNVTLDQYQIMPNHMHGIIVIGNQTNGKQSVGVGFPDPYIGFPDPNDGRGNRAPTGVLKPTLGQIVGHFKYQSTKQINALRKTVGKRIWQRNYYENIIRNENDLNKIRQYIKINPQIWNRDRNNPENIKTISS